MPLVVRLLDATIVSAQPNAIAALPVKLPLQDIPEPVKVRTVLALRLIVLATAPDPTVTVPVPLLASKVAVSDEVGAEKLPAPPLVLDQLVVVLASHVPEPPTQ